MPKRKTELSALRDTPPREWPPTAREMLMQTLREGAPGSPERIWAVDLAGDLTVMDDRMADLLLSIVRSGEELPEVRAKAAISLGATLELTDTEGFKDEISDPPISEKTFHQIQETLRQVYLDEQAPKLVRRRALEASVRALQSWH